MATEIEAIYHNGILELKSALPLKEGQMVRVVVLTEEASIEERVAAMHTVADAWLSQQTAEAVAAPPDYPTEEWMQLDAEWEKLLIEIEQRAGQRPEDEIAADVETAVKAARKQHRRQHKK